MKEKPKWSEKIEKNHTEKNSEKKNERRDEVEEIKRENCMARVGDLKRFSQKSIFVLMYKKEYLVSNDNNLSLQTCFKMKKYLPLKVLNIK